MLHLIMMFLLCCALLYNNVAHRWQCTGEWVRGFCNVPHAQTDTTGVCEGWHSSIKGSGLAEKSQLHGRRLDWLLYKLFYEAKLYQIAEQQIDGTQCHMISQSICSLCC